MSRVNELVHAVANLSHVERPYLENLLAIKKLRLAKDPVDLELEVGILVYVTRIAVFAL